jgi:hypothetical protein
VNAKPATPTYSIDYSNELTDKVVPATDEYSVNSNMSGAVSGAGQKITLTPGQNMYFRTKGTTPSDIQTLTVPARPATPSFAVDYAAENTSTVVSSEYEYSTQSNMSSATAGTGVKVTVTPGSNLYFRKKATGSSFRSAIQTLTVANRPAAPVFTIDYPNERTTEAVSSSYAYSANADMSSATTGSGAKPSLTPGSTLYFRKLATTGEFASSVQVLAVPARPATPSFAIDYFNENTTAVVTSDVEYADNVSMTGAVSGTGAKISLVPGATKYFRKKSTASAFKSAVQTLTVPSRPATPTFTINYAAETIAENVTSDYEYSTNASMSGAVTGTGSKPAVVPGTNLYLRSKATASKFTSGIQTLAVTGRPAAPYYTINYAAETTNEPVSTGDEYAASATMTDAVSGTGSPVTVTPGDDLYLRAKVSGSSFAGVVQKLDVPERPVLDPTATDTLTTKYFLVAVNIDGDDAGFSKEDIETVNCSLTEVNALIFRVEPVQQGLVSLKIKADAILAGNFASDQLTIYYKPSQTAIDDNEISGNLILYPSPVKDYLEVSLTGEGNEKVKIEIMDMYGRLMTVSEFQSGSVSIDCSSFSNGIYIVRCTMTGQEIIRKFIKE